MNFRFLKLSLRLICLCLFTGALQAEIVSITDKDNDFIITKWTTEEGLPQNSVTSIVQTKDGYIWIGTFGGLARFDGIKFTVFDSTNTPDLTSNRILSLFEDSSNTLWIGAETGRIHRLINGKFQEFDSENQFKRKNVWKFEEDGKGNFFISSDFGIEKFRLNENGEIIKGSATILTKEKDSNIYKAPNHDVWVRINKNLYPLRNNEISFSGDKKILLPDNPLHIQFTRTGEVIVGAIETLGIYEEKKYQEILPLDRELHKNSLAILNRHDTLWFQQANSLYEFNGSKTFRHNLAGFVEGGASVMLFDDENNLWLGTGHDGLIKLTRRKIKLLSDLTNVEMLNTYSVVEDVNGTVWVAGGFPIKIQNDRVTKILDLQELKRPPSIRSLAFDADNNLWLGGFGGLFYLQDEKLIRVSQFKEQTINSLFFDNQGNLCLGGPNGFWIYKDGESRHFTVQEGLTDDQVHFITQTKDRTIWIGTVGGISKFKDGKFENLSAKDGLSDNNVREILEDENGTIWIGTYGGGLNRLKDGKIRSITKSQGLPDNFISRILIDDAGKFWILGNRGIFAVDPNELNEVADGKKNVLIGSIYGVSDGMKSSEASGGHQPAGIKMKDGRLWFPMIKGMVIIDPKETELVPPKVAIENISSGFSKYRTTLRLRSSDVFKVKDGEQYLEIEYTGLSFTKPEKIRFFYKIEELDKDWIDAGTRRTAFYPYLPSGKYTFLVKAVNANGVWSEETASLSIDVAKPFWQTWWFILASLAIFLTAGFLIYRFRLNQVEKRQLFQEEFSRRLLNAHENERKRISKELHDGLGQNLLLIKNRALLGLSNSAGLPETTKEHLDGISGAASEALAETRGIVNNLTPQHLKRFGLTEAIYIVVEQVEKSTGIIFEIDINNIDGKFCEETELSIYRIVQECLNNIVKHSESPRGEILIDYQNNQLTMRICDFGKGFAPDETLFLESDHEGFGLRNVSQRLNLLGGNIHIDSAPGKGATIVINIELSNE